MVMRGSITIIKTVDGPDHEETTLVKLPAALERLLERVPRGIEFLGRAGVRHLPEGGR